MTVSHSLVFRRHPFARRKSYITHVVRGKVHRRREISQFNFHLQFTLEKALKTASLVLEKVPRTVRPCSRSKCTGIGGEQGIKFDSHGFSAPCGLCPSRSSYCFELPKKRKLEKITANRAAGKKALLAARKCRI